MREPEFFDIHFHALSLSHPGMLSYLRALRERKLETVYSQVGTLDYLAGALFHRGGERIRNLLAVMENDPGDIFMLMEDDLAGGYARPGDPPPPLRAGAFHMCGREYRKLAIAPLIMDFSRPGPRGSDLYYNRPPAKPVEIQILDLLAGINAYRKARPEGFLEIHPFLGVDPANHSLESLQRLVGQWFGAFRRGKGTGAFAGVKLYPPLGFDAWPEAPAEREKAEFLFGECEARGIPIITHCDDQGFRTIGMEEAWKLSSPHRFRPVLERFPELRIDFAHFGRRYASPLVRGGDPGEWRDAIVALMLEYPHVYADFSFNGVAPEYYRELSGCLDLLSPADRETVSGRLMFGSDFPMCLVKVESYLEYYRVFEGSSIAPALRHRFASENPARFLSGED